MNTPILERASHFACLSLYTTFPLFCFLGFGFVGQIAKGAAERDALPVEVLGMSHKPGRVIRVLSPDIFVETIASGRPGPEHGRKTGCSKQGASAFKEVAHGSLDDRVVARDTRLTELGFYLEVLACRSNGFLLVRIHRVMIGLFGGPVADEVGDGPFCVHNFLCLCRMDVSQTGIEILYDEGLLVAMQTNVSARIDVVACEQFAP